MSEVISEVLDVRCGDAGETISVEAFEHDDAIGVGEGLLL